MNADCCAATVLPASVVCAVVMWETLKTSTLSFLSRNKMRLPLRRAVAAPPAAPQPLMFVSEMPPVELPMLVVAVLIGAAVLAMALRWSRQSPPHPQASSAAVPLLECIRSRRSVFPRSYVDGSVPRAIMHSILEAAMWAPYHGSVPPWRFVVLGRKAMVEMQHMTLAFYDKHWRETGWANGKHGTEADYLKWRTMTEEEIHGRWGPVSFMVAIVMRRQAGSKRLPEWEEAAATACAVQNMHLQACANRGVACCASAGLDPARPLGHNKPCCRCPAISPFRCCEYVCSHPMCVVRRVALSLSALSPSRSADWSSWHDAARDSSAMASFLGMGSEDRCLGFFVVAACDPGLKDSRTRAPEAHLSVEWRT